MVVLQAERMQVEIVRVAEQLCQKVRNVAFQIPDCAALEDRLRVEYGMPVLAGQACFAQCGLVLLFSATPKGETAVRGGARCFISEKGKPQLRTERCRLQTVALALKNGEALPDLWDQTSLLAALWEMGYVSLRQNGNHTIILTVMRGLLYNIILYAETSASYVYLDVIFVYYHTNHGGMIK